MRIEVESMSFDQDVVMRRIISFSSSFVLTNEKGKHEKIQFPMIL